MKPRGGEFEDLRLAAKAADRGKAARQEWPAFEERLKLLGYSPCAIAHAFSTLSGAGTVAEALEVVGAHMPESHPIALSFEVTEPRGGPSALDGVTITSIERDDSAIHVNYEIVGPLAPGSDHPAHPDHVGRVCDPDAVGSASVTDLEETSARSAFLAR
jgi:hypothetical protein